MVKAPCLCKDCEFRRGELGTVVRHHDIWNTVARKHFLQRLDNASRGGGRHTRYLDEVVIVVGDD